MQEEIHLNANEMNVVIADQNLSLNAILANPPAAKGLIIFAHGSGSGRLSPRNQYVARVLQNAEFGTLLLDLLTEEEANDRKQVFNIALLAERLILAKNWAHAQPSIKTKKIGYFGASTGAGAALMAAAVRPADVFAVVSRGGRPDLAGDFLSEVKAPTLLLVGGNDGVVIDLNHEALEKLTCPKKMELIPGATHLFEEPGTLEQVAEKATDWFSRHL